jgi:hypothetical protein
MPEISRFLGIIIRMYIREHAPPHFHTEYGKYEIETVETGSENINNAETGLEKNGTNFSLNPLIPRFIRRLVLL